MRTRFDPRLGLIVIHARLIGPASHVKLRVALDTGATSTLINRAVLIAVGFEPSSSSDRVEVTTGSGVEYVPVVRVNSITALGKQTRNFPVLAHTLPPSAGVDGLIGLDFLRGRVLTLDFKVGTVALGPSGTK